MPSPSNASAEVDLHTFVRMDYIRDIPVGYMLVAGIAGLYLRAVGAVHPIQTGIVRMLHRSLGFYCTFVKVRAYAGVRAVWDAVMVLNRCHGYVFCRCRY